MRKETEMFVNSVVQEDRPVTDLLDANYTFLNERLAKHYGIPNIYGSNFRRVELPPEFDMRRGLLGKGSFLTISSDPNRTSPVAAARPRCRFSWAWSLRLRRRTSRICPSRKAPFAAA